MGTEPTSGGLISLSQRRDVVEITSLSSQGQGVGRGSDGRVVFVPLTAPGDRACIRITKQRKRHGFGVLEAIESGGEGRVTPRCALFGRCGGCDWQHLAYEHQLHWKRENLQQTLQRIGSIDLSVPPDVTGSALAYGTRTRARMQIHEDGGPGFYQRASKDKVEVSHCPVLSDALNGVLEPLSRLLPSFPLPLHELRLLSSGSLVILSLHVEEGKQQMRLSRKEQQNFGHWCERLQLEAAGLNGCVLYRGVERMASWGEPWLEAGVVPTRYRAEGFAQASFAQNEVLVSSVLEMVASVGSLQGKRLVEIYAGRGNLTMPLAREGAHVLALEVDTQAVADAKLAVEANELTGQVTFAPFHDERESLHDVCEQHQHWPDGVLVDPPARGLSAEVQTQLLALRPGWIAYVSCDAATLARDLRGLLDGGYELVSVAGVDLMPQTSHVEAIALVRLQSDK